MNNIGSKRFVGRQTLEATIKRAGMEMEPVLYPKFAGQYFSENTLHKNGSSEVYLYHLRGVDQLE